MEHLKNTTPLCYLPDGRLVCYSLGNVIILKDERIIKTFPVMHTNKERIWGRCRYLHRLLRMGVRAAWALDLDTVLLSISNAIHELNISTGDISEGYLCDKGVRPLIFSEIRNLKGFEDGIYFGGYLGNRSKHPVCIYKRSGVDRWDVVFTFPQGAINHVHAIVPDPYRSCVWIFTGDFGESAAIWKATDSFQTVNVMFCNEQKYRGCVAFALPEGLLYATDTPFDQNSIFLLSNDMKLIELKQIDGSCIYGCKWNDKFVFSTTVEPDGINPSLFQAILGRKRGLGIKDDYVHMYQGDVNQGFEEIYKLKKDALPYSSFQFGVFRFPYGVNKTGTLYFQPVATSRYDLCLIRWNPNE